MDAILKLKNELKNDPNDMGYDLDNPSAILSLLNTRNKTKVVDHYLTELGIFNTFGNPEQAETFLQKVENLSDSNPVVKRMFKWIQPGSPGLNVGNAIVRQALDSLVGYAGITVEEISQLKDDAERTISRAEELDIVDIGEDVLLGHVNQAIVLIRSET